MQRTILLKFCQTIVVVFLCGNFLNAQDLFNAPPTIKKKETKPIDASPYLQNKGASSLTFDEDTKRALEKSGKPGVLEADDQEDGKIFRIIISGLHKVEPEAVLLKIASKVNTEPNESVIASDVKNIYKMGLFKTISVYENTLPNGALELEFAIKELPTIFQVKIDGNENISKEDIESAIAGLEQYQMAKADRIEDYRQKIVKLYELKGYRLAVISANTEDTKKEDIEKREKEIFTYKGAVESIEIDTAKVSAPDFVDVIFTIKENDKIYIDRLGLQGFSHIDEDFIRPLFKTRESHLLSAISDIGQFNEDFVKIDEMIFYKIAGENGLLRAQFGEPKVLLSPDKSRISAFYNVIEGKQYTLGNINIEGDLIETSEIMYDLVKKKDENANIFLKSKLLNKIRLKQGDVFNKTTMAEDVLTITEKYRDIGYAYANIYTMDDLDDENLHVDITLNVESGPLAYIEIIEIEGNEKTKDIVIRREMKINEGEKYSSSLLKTSELNIQRLGFFDSVEVLEEPGSREDLIKIKIKVKEARPGGIQVGAAYGSQEGLGFRAQMSIPNLFGRGQYLALTANYGSYRQTYDVNFAEPYLFYLFDNPVAFSITAFNRSQYYGEFQRNSSGGDITFGYPIGSPLAKYSDKWLKKSSLAMRNYKLDFEALSLGITYSIERVRIEDSSIDVRHFDLHQDMPKYTTSIKPTLRLDQRDNRLMPTRGLYFDFSVEYATKFLGAGALSSLENNLRKNKNKDLLKNGREFLIPPSSANNFARYTTNFRIYHNLNDWFFIKGFVFKSNIELGLLNTFGKPLAFENYALGGGNNLRGYAYRSVSPVIRAGSTNPFGPRRDFRIGGNKEFYGSFELEFPLIELLKLRGVLFFDYGNVFSHEDNLFYIGEKSDNAKRFKPSDPLKLYSALGLYSSAGFGFRWLSPFGYLRFEFGFPLNKRPKGSPGLLGGDDTMTFEFNVGPSF